MSIKVEQAVATFLGSNQIDWEKLKPVMYFVVLWNRLEARHGKHITVAYLEVESVRVARLAGFDISKYIPSISFFKQRYKSNPHYIDGLFRARNVEPNVQQSVTKLLSDAILTAQEQLQGTLMIPYRIRNNLFHGNKETKDLYSQTELFENVNEVLCLFHDDM